jgi:hypothetical protein
VDEIDTRLGVLESQGYACTVATLEVQRDELVVRLSSWEQVAALRREVRVPLASVQTVAAEPDPWSALRGIRAPGTGIPGVVAYGVRRMTGTAPDFAAVHGSGPAVRMELAPGAPFSRIMVSVPDAESTAAALRAGVTPYAGTWPSASGSGVGPEHGA